jgi:hypothetical protein
MSIVKWLTFQKGVRASQRGVALDAQDMEREERKDCCRDAAGSEPAGDAPSTVPLSPCVSVPPVLVLAA